MQLHSAATSSSNLTGNADDFQQLPVVQAPGSPGAVTRSARRFFAALHRAARDTYLLTSFASSRARDPLSASALASATISNALLRGPWVRASERASMLAVETEQSRRLRSEAKMFLT